MSYTSTAPACGKYRHLVRSGVLATAVSFVPWMGADAATAAQHAAASPQRPASAPASAGGPRMLPPPTMLVVGCDIGGCWDEFGVRYDRAGGGVFIRPDGKECRAVRGRMACAP